MKKVLLGLGIIVALAPTIASAGGYLGASYGRTELDVSNEDKTAVASSGVSLEDIDQGYKIFGGYRFNDNLAVEGFYAGLGDAELSAGGDWAKLAAYGYGLTAVGIVPVSGEVDLFAKVGMFHWSADLTSNVGLSAEDDGTDITYGVGASYNLGTVSLRAEFERFDLSGENVDMISAGAAINF